MATFKSTGYQSIGTTATEVYTVPYTEDESYDSIIVLGMTLSNISLATADVTLKIKTSDDEITLLNAETLAIGETKYAIVTDKIVLEVGDIIEVTSSTVDSIDFHMSFMGIDCEFVPPSWFGDTGLLMGGGSTHVDIIESIEFASGTTNSSFSTLGTAKYGGGVCSDVTTGLYGGGSTGGGYTNAIESIVISSGTVNSSYNTLTTATGYLGGCADGIIGLFGGGHTTVYTDLIESVTFATDVMDTTWGSLSQERYTLASFADSTEGVFSGGYYGVRTNLMDSVTFASATLNSSYGTLETVNYYITGASNDTIGTIGGGRPGTTTYTDSIEHVVIASATVTHSYAYLSVEKYSVGSCANSSLGLYAGGEFGGSVIESMELANGTMNSSFSSLSSSRRYVRALSGN